MAANAEAANAANANDNANARVAYDAEPDDRPENAEWTTAQDEDNMNGNV